MKRYKVCFYDKMKDRLVKIKDFSGSMDSINYASLIHSYTYKIDSHAMPYSIWIAFSYEGDIRIFFLDSNLALDQAVLYRINDLVREAQTGNPAI